ncbi:MAG TPA: hypothetical protein VNL91_08965, partial [Thermoanaerobaculia bacterium]|nr:hypothetical protein [Thermoanaerobaculia bacterium]
MSEPSSWNAFWHRAEPAINLTMLRIVASGTALWVLLSRPSLPQIASWPRPFYDSIPAGTRIRYGLFADTFLEQALFVVLIGMLVLAAAGVAVRATAFASALLLYHFAPFESVIWTPNPYLRGLTIPLLALLFIAFGPPHRDGTALVSAWPVRAVQVVLAQMYFFAGYAKLLTSGIAWAGGENIGRYLQL